MTSTPPEPDPGNTPAPEHGSVERELRDRQQVRQPGMVTAMGRIGHDGNLVRVLREVASGNRDAFAEFYDRTCGQVYGLITHMIDDHRRSEEITRQTYAEVWGTASRYRAERSSPTAWLLRLAHRLTVADMRSRQHEHAQPIADNFADAPEPRRQGENATREHEIMLESFWPTVQHRERKDLYRSYYRAMTSRQIAQTDDIPVEVVRSSIKTALLAVHLHYVRTSSHPMSH